MIVVVQGDVEAKNGPSTADRNMLDCWRETHGYVCGNRPGNTKFFMKSQHRCGNSVETQYYDSIYVTRKETTKGRQIKTDPICYWCYDDLDVVVKGTKVKKKQDLNGKNQLPIFRTHAMIKQLKIISNYQLQVGVATKG